MNYKIVRNVDESVYPDLLRLIHESFEEHKDNGLNFTCSSYTLDDLKSKVLSGFYFIAIDDNNKILGITSVSYNDDSKSAYENISAVSPSTKGLGVGSALYKERTKLLKSLGCKYMLSDTAVDAKSSVRWHLKKCNCRIVDYRSYKSTNYYSYVFREDFEPVSFSQKLRDKYNLVKGFIYFHLFFTKEGSLTRIGKIKFNGNNKAL